MQRPAVCTARHNRVREQAPAFASVLHDASAIISVKLAGDLSSHESSGHHQSMETPPLHVLLALDAQILGGEVGYGTSTPSDPVVSLTGHDDDGDEDGSPSPARDGPATVADEVEGTTRTAASSRFWGVTWHQENNKWLAQYRDADGKMRCIGHYDDEEEAARAYNDAISDAGLEGKRHTNASFGASPGTSGSDGGRRSTPTRTARCAASATSTPRRTRRTPSTPRSALFLQTSNVGATRTRSSTGSWCRVCGGERRRSAAATKPPPRRRRAPATPKDS